MKSEQEVNRVIEQYADTVRRICFVHLKNKEDTEDIFQTVLLKYILYSGSFENENHEKAWIIRVTINCCKDLLKNIFRKTTVALDVINEEAVTDDTKELLQIVLNMPPKYRDVIYLHYYERYTAPEIGKIIDKNENTVYTLLSRGRKLLKEELSED